MWRVFLLNLPRKVSKGTGSLEYIYDAAGSKLAKKLDGTVVNFYCGSVVYTGSKAVEYVAHPEGIAHKSGSGFSYQYNQTDHLGNVRSVADASKAVVQATDYFPFGLAHSTSNLAKNKYLYNGKELQNDVVGGTPFGQLDYGARMYDATLGVWRSIDPLAEKYYGYSPYNYVLNRPLNAIDPNGEYVIIIPLAKIAQAIVVVVVSYTAYEGTKAAKAALDEARKKSKTEDSGKTSKQEKKESSEEASSGTTATPPQIGPEQNPKKSGKNEKHGDSGRALTKAEKQIQDLEKQKLNANKKESAVIKRKIENIKKDAKAKEKGEEHSRAVKR